MVDKITLKDSDKFYKLGKLVNSKFEVLFRLEDIIESEYDDIIGYYDTEKMVAFLHYSKMYETVDIINIVVDSEYRNQGIATKLINEMINSFDDVTSIMLEVNENNLSAINLYKKNNFYVINKRENYYGSDTALIMKRDV